MARKLKRGFYWRKGVIWIRTDPIERKARSTGCHSPAAAESWRARREELAHRPRYAASLSEKVEDWVKRTIAYKTGERSGGTLHMYRVKLGHVLRIFGADSPIGSITPGTLDAYLAKRREEGAKNNTIARELSCLRQMLRLAKRAGVYEPDIAEVMPVGFSAKYKPVTRTLALADVPKLLAALRNDQERAWVCLALALGADVGDVERATVADYDPIRGVMMVHGTKNISRAAEVPVLDHVRPLLEFALPHLPVSWPRASKGVGEACKRAGLPHLSPKDLRRSAASWLVAAGADQGRVGRFLRHKSDTMVRLVYGQMRPEELGALIAGDVSQALHTLSGPLAEQADAGDLKGPPKTSTSGTGGESEGASGPEEDQNGGDGVTPALHGEESPRLRAQIGDEHGKHRDAGRSDADGSTVDSPPGNAPRGLRGGDFLESRGGIYGDLHIQRFAGGEPDALPARAAGDEEFHQPSNGLGTSEAGLSAAEQAEVTGIRADLRYALSQRPGLASCSPAAWSLAFAVARIGGRRG